MATFTGTSGNDVAIVPSTLSGFTGGTAAALNDSIGDIFNALGGNDVVIAGGGDDTITGGAGNDNLVGNAGFDVFVYDAATEIGGDTIDGGLGVNTLRVTFSATADFRTANIATSGTTSIDRLELTNASGSDVVFNGAQVSGTAVSTTLGITGSAGTDRLSFLSVSGAFNIGNFSFASWSASDRIIITASASANITGTTQNDSITGSNSDDTLRGGNGDDTLNGGFGSDSLDGGAGIDTNVYSFYNDPVFWNMATGAVSFFTAVGAANGTETAVNFENVELGNGNDSVTGTDGANSFLTGGGNDTVIAGLGNDLIYGSLGADSLSGGNGDDIFANLALADLTGDTIDGGADAGLFGDRFQLYFTGAADLSGVVFQSAGTTSIEGLGLFGGGGHDVSFDASQFSSTRISTALAIQGDNAGVDIVRINNVSSSFDASAFSFLQWNAAVDRIVINGAGTDDTIIGTGVADSLSGGDGVDNLEGGLGADTLVGGANTDNFIYRAAGELIGDSIDGGSVDGNTAPTGPADVLLIGFSGTADLTGANNVTIRSTGTTSIEKLALFNGGIHNVIFDAAQFNPEGVSTSLFIQADAAAADTITINNANSTFSAASFGFSGWNAAVDRIVINGTGTNDTITGTSQADSLTGGDGADDLYGGSGNDTLIGGLGDDYFEGRAGADSLVGGDGNDSFNYYALAELTGDTIDGGADSGGIRDFLHLDFAGAADLSGVVFQSTGTTSIEYLALAGAGHDVSFNASQFGATGLSTALTIQGDHAGADIIRINAVSGSFDASVFSFVLWNAAADRIVINGTGTGDTIIGSSQADSISGGDGADQLFGNDGNDTQLGGLGSDSLIGGAGADSLSGGDGSDTFAYFSLAELAGDSIDGGVGVLDDLQLIFAGTADLSGVVFQSTGATSIEALSLSGGSHDLSFNASQFGATGISTALSIQGDDAGADIITINAVSGSFDASAFAFLGWNAAVDRIAIIGTGTNDTIFGSSQADSLSGGDGADQLLGNDGNDTLLGQLGTDTIFGGAGADSNSGGDGSDFFTYFNLSDLTGDTIDGGADAGGPRDVLQLVFAGAGDLSGVVFQSTGQTSIEYLSLFGAGHDVSFNASQFSATGLSTALAIQGDDAGADIIRINNVSGSFDASAFAIVSWNAAIDRLIINGAGTADSITGSGQNDSLTGGLGNDTLSGGAAGNDSFDGGGGVDTLSYAASTSGAGILFYMLAPNLNGGDAAGDVYSLFENVTGTSVNDRIYMDNSDNSVQGGGGAFDTVELYAGNDSYTGGSGFDYVLAGAGNDVINVGGGGSLIYGEADDDRITATAGSNEFNGGIGNDTLTGGTGQDVILGGAGLDSILGGSGGDFLFGEDGNDTISGDAGNDQIQGGIGLDSLSGGANVDVIQGGADNDNIDGGSEDDFLFGEAGNDTVLGGTGNDQVFGGTENDSLVGNAGIDILNGGDGDDTLNDGGTGELTFSIGGNGNDTIFGTSGQDQMWGGTGSLDTGSDVFVFGAGNGYDIIFDFQGGIGLVDQIRLVGTGIASFAQLQAENRIGQAGANTQINLVGAGNVIFLINTTAATLVADDFLFV